MEDSGQEDQQACQSFMVKSVSGEFDSSDHLEETEMTTPLTLFTDDITPVGGHSLDHLAFLPRADQRTSCCAMMEAQCRHIAQWWRGSWQCPTRVASLYQKLFPFGCKDELREQVKIAWPIVGVMATQYINILVSLIYCGHLGTAQLAALALTTTVINVSSNSVMLGLASACDTLFSQTFGSKNKHRVGIIVQRSIVILSLCCLPCCAILINTEHIMNYIGQDPRVARLGGKYALIYIAGLPAVAYSDILSKYLQAQCIVIPSLVIGIVANFLNVGFHALFLFMMKLDIVGASISVTLTHWSIFLLHVTYIIITRTYEDTWTGFSVECFYDWWLFLTLAVPGLFMVCLEWWSHEIIMFCVGLIGVDQLASHSIAYTMASMAFMLPLGLSVAASVRVGNHLGTANPCKALTASRVSILIAVTVAAVSAITFLALKNIIPYLFTNDRTVVVLASRLLMQVALFELFDQVQAACSGVIRGIGLQKFGAITNFLCYYLVALPLGIPLLLETSLGVSGAWWAVTLSAAIQSVVFLVRILSTNWELESEKAQIRIGIVEGLPKHSSRGQNLGAITLQEDTLSTDTQELMEADHLTLSDTSSHRSDDSESQQPPVCTTDLINVLLTRFAVLFSFLVILAGAITLRVYLDGLPSILNCVVINATNLNMSYMQGELYNNNHTVTLSDLEWKVVNMTYLYEMEHNWNQTFVYCNGVIKDFTPDVSWPLYNNTRLFGGLHPHMPTRPIG